MEAVSAARDIISILQSSWELGDGDAFASVFTNDADFTNIVGETIRGRIDIAAQHAAIFASIYRGSAMRVDDVVTTAIFPRVATIEIKATVIAPFGELTTHALVVIVEADSGWAIRSFHNMVPYKP